MGTHLDLEKTIYRVFVGAIVVALLAAVLSSLDDIKRELRIMRM
jgi:hypothetical protein